MLNVQSTRRPPLSIRSDTEHRRRQLIDVTIAAMAEVGFEGATLGEIAGRAGVSPGLVAHHFESKDGLLAAAFRSLVRKVGVAMLAGLRTARTPRERLQAVVDAHLGDQDFDERAGAAWLAFWGHVPHDDRLRRLQRVYQRRMLSNLGDALARVGGARAEAMPLAGMIAAMIDGVWLRAALSGWTEADGASARRLLTQFVESQVRLLQVERGPEPRAGGAEAVAAPAKGGPGDKAERAIKAARAAQPAWAALPDARRRSVVLQAAVLIGEASDALARLEAAETGAPFGWAVDTVAAARRWMERLAAAPAPAAPAFRDPSGLQRVWSEPEGVVVARVDERSPLLGLCLRIAGALVSGDGVIVYATPQALKSCVRVAELVRRAGAPDAILQVLPAACDGVWSDGLPPVVLPPCAPVVVVLGDGDVDRACDAVWRARLPDETCAPVVLTQRRMAGEMLKALVERARAPEGAFGPLGPSRVLDLAAVDDEIAPQEATVTLVAFDTDDDLARTLGRLNPLKRLCLYGRDVERACDVAAGLPVAACVVNPCGPLDDAVIDLIPGAFTGVRWRRLLLRAGAGRATTRDGP